MNSRWLYGLFIFNLGLQVGCGHMTVQRSESVVSSDVEHEYSTASFLFGFVPARRLSEVELCANAKVQKLSVRMTGGDVGLALITLGIYLPQKILVSCSTPGGPTL
jgi:Bor protein